MKLLAVFIAVQSQHDGQVYILLREYNQPNAAASRRSKESLLFIARQTMKGLQKSTRYTVAHEESLIHIKRHSQPIAAYAVTDKQYPRRVVFSFLGKVLEAFMENTGQWWLKAKEDSTLAVVEVKKLFEQYQTPAKVDKLTQALEKTEQTKAVLYDDFRKLLSNQDDLLKLVEDSKDLSQEAKGFYTTALATEKGCCSLF